MTLERVAYVGLGTIGSMMATSAARKGYEVRAFDLERARLDPLTSHGVIPVSSAADAAAASELIGVIVPSDDDVKAAVLGTNGVLEGAAAGSVIALHSTITPETVLQIGEAAGKKGVSVVDAPVTRGVVGTENQMFLYMVGGEEEAVRFCEPAFSASGARIIHVGPLGSGAAMKLIQQAVLAMSKLAAFEGYRLADKLGLSLERASEVLVEQYRSSGTWLSGVKDGGAASVLLGGPDMRSVELAQAAGQEVDQQSVPLALAYEAMKQNRPSSH